MRKPPEVANNFQCDVQGFETTLHIVATTNISSTSTRVIYSYRKSLHIQPYEGKICLVVKIALTQDNTKISATDSHGDS